MTLDELIATYPVFQNVRCGVSVGPGWVPILADMAKELATIERVELSQVKEKFGGLRVYSQLGSANDGAVDRIIARAEDRASRTCEECGAAGKSGNRTPSSWVRTLCEGCLSRS